MLKTMVQGCKANQTYCKARKKAMPIMECLDSYVTANALPNRRSACHRCMQGQRTRVEYANS